jgi:hypothetical protein
VAKAHEPEWVVLVLGSLNHLGDGLHAAQRVNLIQHLQVGTKGAGQTEAQQRQDLTTLIWSATTSSRLWMILRRSNAWTAEQPAGQTQVMERSCKVYNDNKQRGRNMMHFALLTGSVPQVFDNFWQTKKKGY